MTTIGNVTAERQPLAPLTLLDSGGNRHTLSVIVDTGFTGELALPEIYIRQLGLALEDYREVRPATGEIIRIPSGEVPVIWQGRQHRVQVLQLDSEPLLGMEFLWRHRIIIDAITNGAVTVTPLST